MLSDGAPASRGHMKWGVRARGEASQSHGGTGSVGPACNSCYTHLATSVSQSILLPLRSQETRVQLCTSPALSWKSHVPPSAGPPCVCSQDLPMAFVAGLWGVGFTPNRPGENGLGQLDRV